MYDAFTDGGELSIYSTIDNSKMAIQGRSFPFDNSDVVPLGIDVPTPGLYSIGIDHIKGPQFLVQGQGIYLEDTVLNIVHDLRTQPYSFTATQGTIADRFIVRYTPGALSVNENELQNTFVFIKDNTLNVKSNLKIEAIAVFDLTGKAITTYEIGSADRRFEAPFDFSRGMYITIITLENNVTVTKKLMN